MSISDFTEDGAFRFCEPKSKGEFGVIVSYNWLRMSLKVQPPVPGYTARHPEISVPRCWSNFPTLVLYLVVMNVLSWNSLLFLYILFPQFRLAMLESQLANQRASLASVWCCGFFLWFVMSPCNSVGRVNNVPSWSHFFSFISYISGFKVHFNETEPCAVLAKIGTAALHASGPPSNTQGQVGSGSASSLRTFSTSLPFCLLSCGRHHGES